MPTIPLLAAKLRFPSVTSQLVARLRPTARQSLRFLLVIASVAIAH